MPRVGVTHATTYNYREPVRLLPHRLMVRPRDSHDLRLLETNLTVSPPAARTRWAHDVFGNSVCYLYFADATSTERLRIVSTLDVNHYPTRTALPLDPRAEVFPSATRPWRCPTSPAPSSGIIPTRTGWWMLGPHRFLNASGPTGTVQMLTAMTQAIRAEFRYEGRQTEGTNDPVHTLATRSGACRDLALFMMEAVRSLGLAARFVSGYLYDERLVQGGAPVVGGGATHAWCEVYLPGAGWVEYDPTNGLIAGRNLIRVSIARTPQQAVPIAGSFLGEKGAFGSMDVDVRVSVS